MYQNRKVILCSFYSFDLFPSAMRFKEQASLMLWCDNTPIFDSIEVYNEYNLPYDEKFILYLKPYLKASRGFGYWCWKPFVILKTLQSCQEGDIVIYLDIGCTLSPKGTKKMQEYLTLAIKNTFVCGEIPSIEREWSKADLLRYMGALHDTTMIDTPQRPGGVLFLCKNHQSLLFITQWLQVFYDDFSLVDDTPSKIPNLAGFREHRHDQSVFSLLSKRHNLAPLDFITEFHSKSPLYPINAARNKVFFHKILQQENSCFNALLLSIRSLIPKKQYRMKLMDCLNTNLTNLILSTLNDTNFKFTHKDIFIDICTFVLLAVCKKDIYRIIKENHAFLSQELGKI